MSTKLTVLVPGIRPANWPKLYRSIEAAITCEKYPWEVIFISPNPLPNELRDAKNVTILESFRSPIASQQQGLVHAKGEYIAWCADDGVCLPGSFDAAFALLEGKDYKHIIIGKYFEGDSHQDMDKGFYYCLHYHDTMKLAGVPANARLLNCGLVSRQLLEELGGWDAFRFQACPMAYNDLSIRALKYGATFELMDKPMFQCSWTPGMEGDHGPIHVAQIEYDEPIFRGLYQEPNKRMVIGMDSWRDAEEVWPLRFGASAFVNNIEPIREDHGKIDST